MNKPLFGLRELSSIEFDDRSRDSLSPEQLTYRCRFSDNTNPTALIIFRALNSAPELSHIDNDTRFTSCYGHFAAPITVLSLDPQPDFAPWRLVFEGMSPTPAGVLPETFVTDMDKNGQISGQMVERGYVVPSNYEYEERETLLQQLRAT